MSLPSILAWGPLMHFQRPTPAVAVAVGASALNAICFLTQPTNIHLQLMGGLQPPLVSLPGLLEGFIMLVVSPSGLGAGSHLAAGLQNSCSSPPLALLQHGSALLSPEMAPKGRQDVLDGLFHLVRLTGQQARQPSE